MYKIIRKNHDQNRIGLDKDKDKYKDDIYCHNLEEKKTWTHFDQYKSIWPSLQICENDDFNRSGSLNCLLALKYSYLAP